MRALVRWLQDSQLELMRQQLLQQAAQQAAQQRLLAMAALHAATPTALAGFPGSLGGLPFMFPSGAGQSYDQLLASNLLSHASTLAATSRASQLSQSAGNGLATNGYATGAQAGGLLRKGDGDRPLNLSSKGRHEQQ